MCLAPITNIYAPLLLKANSSTFTVTKKFWPPYWALPLFRHILQQPVPLIQTPASSLNFAPNQLYRLLPLCVKHSQK